MDETPLVRPVSRKQHKRGNSSSFGPYKLYEVTKDGSVRTSPFKLLSASSELLSTDETEVKQQVQQIEKAVFERALEKCKMQPKKPDTLRTVAQINDITFKYRIQNGGVLTRQSRQGPVEVSKVPGLDVTPAADRTLGGFAVFQRMHKNPVKAKVRADYPAIGSGYAYSGPRITGSIIHDPALWDNFTKNANRFHAVPGKAVT